MSVLHIKTAKRRITQTTPRDSPGSLVLWRQKSLVDDPFPQNLRSNSHTSFQKPQFRPISTHDASTVRAGKKVQLVLIGSRLRAFQRAIDKLSTLPLSPQRVIQNAILLFLTVKFKFCRMKSATKFLCVKTPSGKVVATTFLYLTVHRWIAGDVPIYLKLALKVTHLFRKRRYRQISLNSAAAVTASENSSIITNRKSTTRFPSSHRWTLCVTPKSPKGWLKARIFTFGVAFHFFVAGNRRHLKFNMWFEHSKFQLTDDKPSLKWAWPRHMTHFKRLVSIRYLWNGLS